MLFPIGSAEPKAAGDPQSSITKRWTVLLRGVRLTTAACDAGLVCGSRAGCARAYYVALPSRRAVFRPSAFACRC